MARLVRRLAPVCVARVVAFARARAAAPGCDVVRLLADGANHRRPTVDTLGNVGFDAKLGFGGGPNAVLIAPSVGGSVLGREKAGALWVAPEISYWFEGMYGMARIPALRGGAFFSGRYLWDRDHEKRLQGLGANFAILPRLRDFESHDRNLSCFVHLGVELSGEYDWGSGKDVANRGIFSVGLTSDLSCWWHNP
jgi:hypothetical protein